MNFAFFWTCLAVSFLFAGCSAPGISVKCQEIRNRLAYQDLSEDQRRFIEAELGDCEQNLEEARRRDSLAVENLEHKVAPKDSL